MKDLDIKLLRLCEKYVRENPEFKNCSVEMDYSPNDDLRIIEVKYSPGLGNGGLKTLNGKLIRIWNGSDIGEFVEYIKENLPSNLLPSEENIKY